MKKIAYCVSALVVWGQIFDCTSFAKSSKLIKRQTAAPSHDIELLDIEEHQAIDIEEYKIQFTDKKEEILNLHHIAYEKQMSKAIDILRKREKSAESSDEKYQAQKRISEFQQLLDNELVIEKAEQSIVTPVITLDLSFSDNLRMALLKSLFILLNPQWNNVRVTVKNMIPDIIHHNPELETCIRKLLKYLLEPMDSEPEFVSQLYFILKDCYHLIKQCSQFKTDALFKRFGEYIQGVKRYCQVLMARSLANQLIEQIKPAIENHTQKKVSGKYAGFGVSTPGAIKVQAGTEIYTDKRSTDAALLEVSYGVKCKIGISAGLSKIITQIGISVGIEAATTSLYYSIFEVIDNDRFDPGSVDKKIRSDVKDAVNMRKKMQEQEKKLLMVFDQQIESFLVMIGIAPVSVHFVVPGVTTAKQQMSRSAKSVDLEATVAAFDTIGVNAGWSHQTSQYIQHLSPFTYVDTDMKIIDGCSVENLKQILGGNKYDRSNQFLVGQSAESAYVSNEYGLSIILGDVRRYLNALQSLAVNAKDKDSTKIKHDIEQKWLPKRILGSEGRSGVFKSFFITAATMRDVCQLKREIEFCAQIYVELKRLEQMMVFAKGKQKSEVDTAREYQSDILSGKFAVSSYGIEFSFKRTQNSPFLFDNHDYLTCTLTLPMALTGIMGMNVAQKILSQGGTKLRNSSDPFAHDTSDAFLLIAADALNLLGSNGAVPFIDGILTGSVLDFIGASYYTFSLRKTDKNVIGHIPLPGSTEMLQPPNNTWNIQYVEIMPFSDYGLSPEVLGAYVSAGLRMGDKDKIWGKDTILYLLQQYCMFRLGNQNTAQNSPIINLEEKQAMQIAQMLISIADMNSNIRFELQNIFNQTLEGIHNDVQKQAYTKLIANLLENSSTLADMQTQDGDDSDSADTTDEENDEKSDSTKQTDRKNDAYAEQYQKTLKILNDVMDCYYKYVFDPYKSRAFMSKTKKGTKKN